MEAIYRTYNLPTWAPPPYVFGYVWPILYSIMIGTFGYVLYHYKEFPTWYLAPIVINIMTNLFYTYLQFSSMNIRLATWDVAAVWLSLAVFIYYTFKYFTQIKWVATWNIPYLIWVTFALALQTYVAFNN